MGEKREEILRVLNYYKQLLEQKGYKVIYIALYGSQNYNVDDKKSDIDAKAIVLPTLSDIIHREPVSAVLETEYGTIDYKDIITFNDVIKKGNFSYIEAIQSSYRIGDLENIDKLFGNIKVNLKSIIGGMKEKRKALTHEYPSKTEEFKLWDCDPKQFHHIWRLADVLNYNLQNNENRSYLRYNRKQRGFMISIKRKLITSLEQTIKIADKLIEQAQENLNQRYPQYKYVPINNTEALDNYVEKEIKKQLIKKD